MKNLLFILIATTVYLSAQEQDQSVIDKLRQKQVQKGGTLYGKVVDAQTGEDLISASILVVGTTIGGITDVNGEFRIQNVPPGTHNISISMVGYGKMTLSNVSVAQDESQQLNVTLTEETIQSQEVVVEAEMLKNTESSLLKMRQRASAVSDAISAELIASSGSSNAADAMTKVTGASVVGGKYVYVRGLGDRYTSTQLNGAELPSADPDKKAFNMDLFPSGVLDNIVTIKSFTPDKPGNFSGGIVDIATKSYPDQLTVKLSTSSSYNTSATFNNKFLTYKGGGSDWFGMDDGSRNMPAILSNPDLRIPSIQEARSDKEKSQLIDDITKSFSTQMSPHRTTAPLNQSYSLSVGDQTELFEMPLGFLGSYTYSRNYSLYENGTSGRWKLTGDVNTVESLAELQYLTDAKGTDEVNWGGLITLNLKPDPRHEIGADLVYTQSGQSTARFLEGRWLEQFNETPTAILETRVLSYTERNLQSYQLHGKHIFDDLYGAGINWSATTTTTSQIEPDARYFTDNYNSLNMNYSINRGNYALPTRFFRNMDEDGNALSVDLSVPFDVWESLPAKFKFGGALNEKERIFTERRFEYQPGEVAEGAAKYNGDPESYFALENIGVIRYDSVRNRYIFGSSIAEVADPLGGDYNGYEKVTAVYGMVEIPVTHAFRFIGGVRYELSKMDVYGKGQKGFLNDKDLLPAASVIYQLTDNMNIRTSYGKTLARPNFREKAPYANFNFVGDFTFLGNPDLKRTLIDNYDARWEWFLRPGEILAVSGFYKKFKNPIERVINVLYASEGGEVFYENIDKADVTGIEIEIRKRLDEVVDLLSNFSIGANVSFIESNVNIPAGELAVIREVDPNAESTRSLQGQSPYLLNLDLGYDNFTTGTHASLFYNIFGDRLAEVSIGGTPDIFERSRPMLDFTLSQIVLTNFTLRFSAKNILDSPYKLTHEFKGAEYIRAEYKTGTSVSLGIAYSLN